MATSQDVFPRFNHIALSVPSDLVSGQNAADLLRFYGEVFEWNEMPSMARDGELLVLRVHSNEQFVYLHASDEPLRCPPGDHFGLSVPTPKALDSVLERARKYKESDGRVEISDRGTEDFKVLKLHNVYIRYLLPMSIELQCFDWATGVDQFSQPGDS